MINLTGANKTAAIKNKSQIKTTNQDVQVNEKEAKVEEKQPQRVSAEYALAAFAPANKKDNSATMSENKPAAQKVGYYDPVFGEKKKSDLEPVDKWIQDEWLKKLPFAGKLTPSDKRNIRNVIQQGDEETEYMKKMIQLVCEKKVPYTATTKLSEHGVMSDMVKNDIDIYYDKVKGDGMSIKDAFVPLHASQAEGQNATPVGDVFRVDGQDKIFIKSGDNSSKQLDMDADTYLELYPPVSRYASSQGKTGDCYLLSSIESIMANPYARPALLDCFHQDGNDVTVQFPDKETQVVFKNGELPGFSAIGDRSKYATGPMGMKLLEHAYGKTYEADKYAEYKDTVAKEMKKMEEELEECKNEGPLSAIKKKIEISKKMANWKAGEAKVDEQMADPNHKMLFVLDDDNNFIIGKYGPMTEDVKAVDKRYSVPSEYYTGGVGGCPEQAFEMLGFNSEYYMIEEDENKIDEALFSRNPEEYLIVAGTPSNETKVESPQDVAYSIYSSHGYAVTPFDDKYGNRMFEVTNPWNQSHSVIMNEEKLKEFFVDFSVVKVNA